MLRKIEKQFALNNLILGREIELKCVCVGSLNKGLAWDCIWGQLDEGKGHLN